MRCMRLTKFSNRFLKVILLLTIYNQVKLCEINPNLEAKADTVICVQSSHHESMESQWSMILQ